MTNPTMQILEVVDHIIHEARIDHKDIPEKIVVVMDSGARKGGMVHGHFAKLTWEGDYHEIKLGTESLSRGAVPTLGTILHELSHAVAFARDVKDTSNKGRYHNAKFREIANEMGIHVDQAGTLGWSQTTVPGATQTIFAEEIERLDKAITTYRKGYVELAGTTKAKTKKTTKMVCGCNDPVSVNKGWFERIGQWATCTNCNENFELVEA